MRTLRIPFLLVALSLVATASVAYAPPPDTLKLATWNLEWLDADLNAGMVKRTQADYDRLSSYADRLDADIIAFQEVEGEEAAVRVFDPSVYDFFFEDTNNAQRVGFAVRKGISVTDDPDFEALRTSSGLRSGVVITVEVDEQPVRLMVVHLKSQCFDQPLSSSSDACQKLNQQVPLLEQWIDEQAGDDTPFIVLGDFNRRMNVPGDDLWDEIDDGDPSNADLVKAAEGRTPLCWGGRFSEYIDHIVLDRRAALGVIPGSFEEMVYDGADEPFASKLSDHCPLSVRITAPSVPVPAPTCPDPIARAIILARIDTIEREVAELRSLILELR